MYDGRPNEPPPHLPIQPQPQYDPNNAGTGCSEAGETGSTPTNPPPIPKQPPTKPKKKKEKISSNNAGTGCSEAGETVSTPTNPPPKANPLPKQPKMKKKEKISSNNAGTGRSEAGETASTSKVSVPKAEVSVPNNSTPPQKPNKGAPKPQNLVDGWHKSEKIIKKTLETVEQSRRTLLSAGYPMWNDLGYPLQKAPLLDKLEARISTFIHCFVEVRGITSLYELEAAICEEEGVEHFYELELGPLVRHPLVIHYFSLSSEVNTVHKITSEDIISYLWEYMSMDYRKKVVAEEFLDFIAQKRSLTDRNELGVHIKSLGLHIATIRKARKLEDEALDKFLKRNFEQKSNKKSTEHKKEKQLDESLSVISPLTNSSTRVFINTWKAACCCETVHEVFDRMLQCYNLTPKKRTRIKSLFLTYPGIGLLDVAITSIKCGLWDSIDETLHAIDNHGLSDLVSDRSSKYKSIGVEPSVKSVTIEDIIRKLTSYFEVDESSSNRKSHLDKQLILLGKLCGCEGWLAEQFAVEDFKSLGHGDFITFVQTNLTQLLSVLINNLVGYIHEKSPFRVYILENQLLVFLSQAFSNSWEDEAISKQKLNLLLTRQFPSISFNILENGPTKDFFNNLRDQQSSAIAKCVLFSATLSGTYDYGNSLARSATDLYDFTGSKTDLGPSTGCLGPVSFDDAMKVLLRAPMLSDLHVWSHWDLVFASSLGPLVGWLLNEVNSKELLCLVTKEGKVVRVNPSATLDSYLEASLQGAPFRTAVELISLFSLYGGKRHLPLSLLKSHTHQAFQVIIKNSGENMGVTGAKLNYTDRAIPVASRFFLDCLGYLPSEFRYFAADVLLFGLRSIIKDAPSSILCECNDIEQRIMLHGIGLTLGVVEWIDDYYTLRSTSNDPLNPSSISCLLPPKSKLTTSSSCGHTASNKLSSSKSDTRICAETDRQADISNTKMGDDCMQNASEQYEHKEISFNVNL